MPPILLPRPLSRDLRQQIRQAYSEAICDADESVFEYVDIRLPKLLQSLRIRGGWHEDLARIAETVFLRLKAEWESPGQNWSFAVAALFYLCNPFDIIPDTKLCSGYLDDYYVMKLCLIKTGLVIELEM
jgi:uncharacterized protein DUF1232